eukprot:CAMPEP_0173249122 /NCGR_PEP_ID=MMETSP1142-20121109/18841_1 /TAXON_ID=483371 /ORGANISM="non described non described, Strain CCMP2298" /LENGTH=193 /DNA_ID=CAMNT_0014181709 /DNA_START=1 /DNA_END=582 /DNA_ORIENTATION=+
MSAVIVSLSSISAHNAMPSQLHGKMDPQIFERVASAVRTAQQNACCMSCCGEWGICLCTGFFCIFFAHSCIVNAVADGEIRSKMRDINSTFYGGRLVVGLQGNAIIINVDNMRDPNYSQQPQQQQQQQQFVQPGQVQYAQPGQVQYAQPGQVQYAQPGQMGNVVSHTEVQPVLQPVYAEVFTAASAPNKSNEF